MAVTVAVFHNSATIDYNLREDQSLETHFSKEQIEKIIEIAQNKFAGQKIEEGELATIYSICVREFERFFPDMIRETIEIPLNEAFASCINIREIQTPPIERRKRRKSCIVQ